MRGADDERDIIPWLSAHDGVWVTRDWHRFRNRAQARWLYEQGVSVAWFRFQGRRAVQVEQLLAVAAEAMP